MQLRNRLPFAALALSGIGLLSINLHAGFMAFNIKGRNSRLGFRPDQPQPPGVAKKAIPIQPSNLTVPQARHPSADGTEPGFPRFYGESSPRIHGLSTCKHFVNSHPKGTRLLLAPAGLFNTGTNLLEDLLRLNCKTREGRPASIWQVPWGKHNPVEWRGRHFAPSSHHQNVSMVMPVMMIKDPFTWMKSMCRKPYAAHFVNEQKLNCPSPVHASRTIVRWQEHDKKTWYPYRSLIHLWDTWNGAYLTMNTPRLIVRYEDLLFNPIKTMHQICSCIDAVPSGDSSFRMVTGSAKSGPGHGDGGSDRSTALATYADSHKRMERYLPEDVGFMKESWNWNLTRLFHYHMTDIAG